jgi:hypothetical protein
MEVFIADVTGDMVKQVNCGVSHLAAPYGASTRLMHGLYIQHQVIRCA